MKKSNMTSRLPAVAAGLLSLPLIFIAACALLGAVCTGLKQPLSAVPFCTVAALAIAGALGTVIFRAVSGIRAPLFLMLPPVSISVLYLAVCAIFFGFKLGCAHLLYSAVLIISSLAAAALPSFKRQRGRRRLYTAR